MKLTTSNARRSEVSLRTRRSFYASRRASRLEPGALAIALMLAVVGTARAQSTDEEILVTGSRISRTTMDTPQPMTVEMAAVKRADWPKSCVHP